MSSFSSYIADAGTKAAAWIDDNTLSKRLGDSRRPIQRLTMMAAR